MLDYRFAEAYKEFSLLRKEPLTRLLSWKNQHVIKIITGVRRCGKSVVLKQLCKEISKDESILENQITFLNFEMLENEELLEYHALYDVLKNRLVPEKINYILLDEIQNVKILKKL